jgi:hypothetical protein
MRYATLQVQRRFLETVNESNAKDRQVGGDPVLRAGDVMPPFSETPCEQHDMEASPSALASERSGRKAAHDGAEHHRSRPKHEARGAKDEPVPPAANAAIPQYDLAEHILAEHRQTTARKRRAPTEPAPEIDEPVSEINEPVRMRTHIPMAGASERELTDLQTIVADIVARDIARLSRGVARTMPK